MEDMEKQVRKDVLKDIIGLMHHMMMKVSKEGEEDSEEPTEQEPDAVLAVVPEEEDGLGDKISKYMSSGREKSAPGTLDIGSLGSKPPKSPTMQKPPVAERDEPMYKKKKPFKGFK